MTEIEQQYFDSPAAFIDAMSLVVAASHRELRMFSETYPAALYENESVIEALKQFCLIDSDVQILCLAPRGVLTLRSHPALLGLAHRMSSKIWLRESPDATKECNGQFVVGDRRVVLHQPAIESAHAYYNPDYGVRAQQLIGGFDRIWAYATQSPEFRAVSI